MVRANLTNYHSHCDFCDGGAPAEFFVREALAQGFSAFGFSSHAPLPFQMDSCMFLEKERVADYLGEISRLRELYKDSIEVYCGMEIDYVDGQQNPANGYFQGLPLDYRIGSVHLLRGDDGVWVDIDTVPVVFERILAEHFAGDLRGLVKAYFDASMRMVETGGFDFAGHPDKIVFNASHIQSNVAHHKWYKDAVLAYFSLIADTGTMLEINTKAYGQSGSFFPDRFHFGLIRELGIPIVVNSDAHFPDMANHGRIEAFRALLQAGIKNVRELHKGRWEDVPIMHSGF